jgi:ribonuclease R
MSYPPRPARPLGSPNRPAKPPADSVINSARRAQRKGVLRVLASGSCVVEVPGGSRVRLRAREARQFLDGDEVLVAGGRQEGFALELVRRSRRLVVGVVERSRSGNLQLKLDPRLGVGILPVHNKAVSVGDAVVMGVDDTPGYTRCRTLVAGPWAALSPEHLRAAALVVCLGVAPDTFNHLSEVTHQRLLGALGAYRDPKVPQQQRDTLARTDFTGDAVVTVDGPDTRDIDDAIWAEPTPSGWRVRVHIADVAAEVPAGSALDDWALAAATSVYLPGLTTPMLPPVISEDRCSLRANTTRRVVTAAFDVDRDGSVSNITVTRGLIRSRARLTYDQVDGLLEGSLDQVADGENTAITAEVSATVESCVAAAEALERRRNSESELDNLILSATVGVKLVDGVVTVQPRNPSTRAWRMIEELMVAANEAVGYWLAKAGAEVLYRRQDDPLVDQLPSRFASFPDPSVVAGEQPAGAVSALPSVSLPGVTLSGDLPSGAYSPDVPIPYSARLSASGIADVLAQLSGLALQAGQQQVLRALDRAYYSPGPGGHFQLGKTHYLHFTSPIRRYADLVVHRVIASVLDGSPAPYSSGQLRELGSWVTVRSGQAARAEASVERSLWTLWLQHPDTDPQALQGDATVTGCHPRAVSVRLVDSALLVDVIAPDPGWACPPGGAQATVGELTAYLGGTLCVRVVSVDALTGRLLGAVVH